MKNLNGMGLEIGAEVEVTVCESPSSYGFYYTVSIN